MSALGSFLKGAGVSLSNQYDTDLSQLREDEALDLRLALQADDPSLRETQRQLRMLSKLEEELRTGGDSQRARIAALRLGVQTASQEETTYQRQLTAGKRSRAGFDRGKAKKIKNIDRDEKKAKGDVKKQVDNRAKALKDYNDKFSAEMVKQLKEVPIAGVDKGNWRELWKRHVLKDNPDGARAQLKNAHKIVSKLSGAATTASTPLGQFDNIPSKDLYKLFFPINNDFPTVADIIKDQTTKVEGGRTEAIETQAEQDRAKVETDTESAIADIEAPTPPGTTALEYAQKYLEYAEGGNLSEADKQKLLADIATDRAKLEAKLAKGPDLTEFREQQEERREEFRTQRPYGRFTFKTVRRSGGLEIPQSIREAYESARVAETAETAETAAGEPGTDPAATAAEQQAEDTAAAELQRRQENAALVGNFVSGLDTDTDSNSIISIADLDLEGAASGSYVSPSSLLGQKGIEFSSLGGRGRLGGYDASEDLPRPDLSTLEARRNQAAFAAEDLEKREISEEDLQLISDTSPENLSRALFGKASPFAKQERDTLFDGPKSAEELGFDLQQKPRQSDDDFFAQQMPVRQELSQPGNAFEGEERLEISGGLPEELLTQYDKNIKEISPYLEAGRISKEDYLKELGGGDKAKGELKIAQMNEEELKDSIRRIKQKDVPIEEEE